MKTKNTTRAFANGLVAHVGKFLLYLLAIIFTVYFVILDNSTFILYSFLLFLALGLMLKRRKAANSVLGIAIAFIYAGSMLYMTGFSSIIMQYSIAVAIVIALLLYACVKMRLDKTYAAIVAFGATLPIFIYMLIPFAPQFVSINMAIVGYYLLISVVLNLFVRILYSQNGHYTVRAYKTVNGFFERHVREIAWARLAMASVILIAPIWPMGVITHTNLIPHANVYLQKNSGTAQSLNGTYEYPIYLDLKGYSNFTNPESGNIRFYYPNGKQITAVLIQNSSASFGKEHVILHLNKSMNNSILFLYFYGYNTSFNSTLMQQPPSFLSNGTYRFFNAGIGNLHSNIRNTTRPLYYTKGGWINSTSVYNVTVSRFMTPQTVCTSGIYVHTTVTLNSTSPIRIFGVYNTTGFADVLSSVGTDHRLSRYSDALSEYGYGSSITSRNIRFNLSYAGTCTFYAILSNSSANIREEVHSVYYANVSEYKNITMPAAIADPNLYRYYTYDFLPASLVHLATRLNVTG